MGRKKKDMPRLSEHKPSGYSAAYGTIYRSTDESKTGDGRTVGYSAIYGPIGGSRRTTEAKAKTTKTPDKSVATDEKCG